LPPLKRTPERRERERAWDEMNDEFGTSCQKEQGKKIPLPVAGKEVEIIRATRH
jgi:hypothetical protein